MGNDNLYDACRVRGYLLSEEAEERKLKQQALQKKFIEGEILCLALFYYECFNL
jgi:hypothetical protein